MCYLIIATSISGGRGGRVCMLVVNEKYSISYSCSCYVIAVCEDGFWVGVGFAVTNFCFVLIDDFTFCACWSTMKMFYSAHNLRFACVEVWKPENLFIVC